MDVRLKMKQPSLQVTNPTSRPPVVTRVLFDAAATIPPPEIVTQRGRRHFAPRAAPAWLQQFKKNENPPGESAVPTSVAREDNRPLRILDGFMLLDACGVEFPDEASRADVQEEGLTDAIAEDLSYFTNMVYLNAGDNELPMENLYGLPSLQELHLHCNCMRSISRLDKLPEVAGLPAFSALEVLDLSFNKLSKESIQNLSALPRLRVLDLTCNSLNALPSMLVEFKVLEVLCLEKNRLERDETLLALSTIPRLRELNIAHNFFRRVSSAVAHSGGANRGLGGFGSLEWLNLAHNYIATEQDIVSLIELPKLTDVILYGNPMTIKGSGRSRRRKRRDGQTLPILSRAKTEGRILNFVTEAPDTRKRRTGVGSYTDVNIRTVQGAALPTNAQWRAAGNRALRRLEREESSETVGQSGPEDDKIEPQGSRPNSSPSSQGKMTSDSSDRQLKEATGFFMTEADDGGDDGTMEDMAGFGEPLVLPKTMLGEPLVPRRSGHGPGVRSDPASLRKAMTSLRHMLKNPLTADDVAEEKTYMKRTNANKGMQKPRIPYVPLRERKKDARSNARGSDASRNDVYSNAKQTNPVLANIEYVLDKMNDRVEQVENDMGLVQYTDTTMTNLIGLVNDVMAQFESEA